MLKLRQDTAAEARRKYAARPLSEDPDVQAIRRLFRQAGCDPTRYRPSSEALLRRILKGEELPAIHPLVDLNNILSVRLAVPCCVVDPRRVAPPFTLRAGRAGETMPSLRGPFHLEGKPALEDSSGPFGTPITDSERVKVAGDCPEVWLVAYLAAEAAAAKADEALTELLRAAPVARLLA